MLQGVFSSREEIFVTFVHPRWLLCGSGGCRKHKIRGDIFHQEETFVTILVAAAMRMRQQLRSRYDRKYDRKSQNLYTQPVFDAHTGRPHRNFAKIFCTAKTRM